MKRFSQDFVDSLTDLELVVLWKDLKDNFPVEDADYIKQLDDECKRRVLGLYGNKAEMKASMKRTK